MRSMAPPGAVQKISSTSRAWQCKPTAPRMSAASSASHRRTVPRNGCPLRVQACGTPARTQVSPNSVNGGLRHRSAHRGHRLRQCTVATRAMQPVAGRLSRAARVHTSRAHEAARAGSTEATQRGAPGASRVNSRGAMVALRCPERGGRYPVVPTHDAACVHSVSVYVRMAAPPRHPSCLWRKRPVRLGRANSCAATTGDAGESGPVTCGTGGEGAAGRGGGHTDEDSPVAVAAAEEEGPLCLGHI